MRAIDVGQILRQADAIAAELAAVAVDPASSLTSAERRALVALSLAVEAGAARVAGILPRTLETEALLAKAMMAAVPHNDNRGT